MKGKGLLAGALLTMSAKAMAWDNFGHMLIDAIAYERLSPSAHARVSALLKINPQYGHWTRAVPAGESADKVAFVMAGTWPDAIKRMRGYQDDGDRPAGPDSARNIGYADKLMHRYWHFIDMPFSPDGTKLESPAAPNVETQIRAFRMTLASADAPDDVKSYDLVWLLHLVGDVHQPLHTTSRFTRDLPGGDKGGNKVALCAFPCRDQLHLFWDDVLGTSDDPAAAIAAAGAVPLPESNAARISDEAVWVRESFEAARESVYAAPVGDGAGPYALDDAYRSAARTKAQERIGLAAVRLANLLNDALK